MISTDSFAEECFDLMTTGPGGMTVVGRVCFNTIYIPSGTTTTVDDTEIETIGEGDQSGGFMDADCNGGTEATEWANQAFQEYRDGLLDQRGYTLIDFITDHPTGSPWNVQFPDGSIATYTIVNPIGNTSINTANTYCGMPT